MNILLWHVHGSWTTAFVQGRHRYLLPQLPDRGPYGRGRAQTWEWPATAVAVTPDEAARADVDLLIVQRPEELAILAETWLGGRVPGRDVPTVYVEHNAPQGRIDDLHHPAADRRDLLLVHVTHFNALLWHTGRTRTRVIEHGIVDPGDRYTGELGRAVALINEPRRRGRVVGADLLGRLDRIVPVDLFGIASEQVGGFGDVAQDRLHDQMAQRRLYLHPYRWTSLGLALLEAMHLGMPVVALATTEAPEAVPLEAGIVSNRWDVLEAGIRGLVADPERARAMGKAGRQAALERYGLGRFLAEWDSVIGEVLA